MFLRRNRRIRNGETYEYWSLMGTVRTAKGPRHEMVAHLGLDVPRSPKIVQNVVPQNAL